MRENAQAKGRRLLAEGRLVVGVVDRRRILATCRGDSGEVYRLAYSPERAGWVCECPAIGRCSHLHALQLVTVRPGGTP